MDTNIQNLADRLAIHDVQVNYARSLDARNFEGLNDVFTPEGVADYEGIGVCEGVGAIKAVCENALNPLTSSQHLLANHWAEIDGDDADAGCYFQAQHTITSTLGGDNWIVAGTYTDRFVRTAAGWRMQRRTLRVTWVDGNPDVLTAGSKMG